MSDTAREVAFSNAPQDERTDALGELQKSHLPTSSDILPKNAMQDLIESIKMDFEEQQFHKSLQNSVVVPYPSKALKEGKDGMQSVIIDDFNVNMNGDFWDRPSALGADSLRAMVEQTPVLNAVIMTRIRQAQRFARVSESDVALPGFEIRHIDRKHTLSKSEQESLNMLNRFMTNSGWEFNARKRKALRRDSFTQFMGKVVRDTLTMDSVGIETEWKKAKNKGLEGFYAVDGGSIRLCSEDGYRGNDEIFALQVVGGMIRTAYTFDDLIYEVRNPRTDVRACGYGLSETELLIRVVTGFLNAMTVNAKGFDSNSIPRGMLHLSGNYSTQDLDAFKRYWNNMVRGVNNAWAMPVLVSKDQESKASFEKFGEGFNEMMFGKWMTFLTSIICAIYGMSPAEINFDSFTAGNTSALGGTDTAEKLAASKDSGLRPLLAYFENLFTDYIISDFSSDYVFRWTGLDPTDEDKSWEAQKLILTVDELRAEKNYEKHPDPIIGSAPLNPSLVGIYMQGQQPEQDQGSVTTSQPKAEDKTEKKSMAKSFGSPEILDTKDWWK
jgi:hypothetical protein